MRTGLTTSRDHYTGPHYPYYIMPVPAGNSFGSARTGAAVSEWRVIDLRRNVFVGDHYASFDRALSFVLEQKAAHLKGLRDSGVAPSEQAPSGTALRTPWP